MHAEVLLYHY